MGFIEDGIYYYEGVFIELEGYEFEVIGKIIDVMNIVVFYIYIDVIDENGDDINKWVFCDVVGVIVDYVLIDVVVVGLNGCW